MSSCQEKQQEKLSPSYLSLGRNLLLDHQESAMSALGWPRGLGHRRNLPLVLKADRTQSQAPGPACPSLCPRPLLHESEHAHSACTRTSRWTWEDWTGGRAAAAMGRGHRAAGERTTRPTGAPGGGRSAPLPFTASSQWFHTPHLTPPHLIPEPGQMALLLAQSPPRRGKEGAGPRAP